MCARYLLRNAYVFEADLQLYNKELITKYQYSSNYLGMAVKLTDDWCFVGNTDKITKTLYRRKELSPYVWYFLLE